MIAVDILQLLDELEAELNAARRSMIGGGVVVDRRRLMEIVEQLRLAIPANIRQARSIIERGEQAITEAEAAAARIVADADREANERVSQAEVIRQARERAQQIELEVQERANRTLAAARADAERMLAEAADRARLQEQEADRYAITVLHGLEERLTTLLGSVREGKAQFQEQG